MSRFLPHIFLSYVFLISGQLFAQQEQITLLRAISLIDSTQNIQSWNYGTDKIANTFLFTSDALMQYAFPFGTEYVIKKRYRGSIMRTNTIAIQDNLTVQGF